MGTRCTESNSSRLRKIGTSIAGDGASYLVPLEFKKAVIGGGTGVSADGNPMRVRGADSVTEVMERIVDRGIVVDPWSGIRLREPDTLQRYRWTADFDVCADLGCDLDRAA